MPSPSHTAPFLPFSIHRREPPSDLTFEIQDFLGHVDAPFTSHDASLHPMHQAVSVKSGMFHGAQRRPSERRRLYVRHADGGAAIESHRRPGDGRHFQTIMSGSIEFQRVSSSLWSSTGNAQRVVRVNDCNVHAGLDSRRER